MRTYEYQFSVSDRLLLAFASTISLGSRPRGTHEDFLILIFSLTIRTVRSINRPLVGGSIDRLIAHLLALLIGLD
jgi:hypothetical protein